jgi:Mitochondrial K+-H+ exchange-related
MVTTTSQQNLPAENSVARLYLTTDEKPELLFFEETILQDKGWRKASEKGRQLWQRLKERYERISCEAFAGDRFLRRLRSFRKITVALNRPIEPNVVREKLTQMIRDRSYHHLRWMIIDALLLPLSLFIMFLPGPNVIGYYLLFRVYSHWKSYRSAAQAQLDHVDVCVDDRAQEVSAFLRKAKDVKSGLIGLRQKFGLRALQEHQFVPQSIGRLVHLLRSDSPVS